MTPVPSPRERILDVASDLFYTEGIRATGVDTIIARAEVAKATFYKHFPSKDDLVLAYVERQDALLGDAILKGLEAAPGGPREKLLSVFDLLYGLVSSPEFRGCPFIKSAVELPLTDHPARMAALTHKHRVRDAFEGLFKAAKIPRPKAMAAHWALLVDGVLVQAWMNQDGRCAKEAKAFAAGLLKS